MNNKLHPVIGIDLGTTYSAVAVYNTYDETPVIVADKAANGTKTTPSVIGVDRNTGRVIVGEAAKRNLAVRDIAQPPSAIEVKREMGEVYTRELLEKIPHDRRDSKIHREGEGYRIWFLDRWFLPQELSAFTLMKMKAIAEAELGCEIRDAVITVPAYFSENQKRATQEAALLAGLYPRQLIPEPTAAAICYGVDKGNEESKTFLVYDLGGGTFDVSIIRAKAGDIDVIATSGDPRLGGGDFDDAIVKWAVEELVGKYGSNQKFAQELLDPRILATIKYHAEHAKIALSDYESTEISFADIWSQLAPTLTLTRVLFDDLIDLLLKKSITFVNKALEAAEKKGVARTSIDAILLVGGSTKVPRVRELLLDHFQKDESFVRSDLDPDAVVARGAALLALRYSRTEGEFDVNRYRQGLKAVNPDAEGGRWNLIAEHSLGIGVQEDEVKKIISQGTDLPITKLDQGYTNSGPCDYLPVNVYQGEGNYIHDNTLIGTIPLGPMEPKPGGFHRFEVEFSINESGLLSVVVHHLNEDKKYQGKFEHKSGVGGDAALAVQHVKLAQMFQHSAPNSAAPNPPITQNSGPRVPPPPPKPEPAAQATVTETAPSATAAPAQPAAPPSAAANGAKPIEIQDRTKVPKDLRPLLRSVQRHLLENPGAVTLLEAFNTFANAVNGGSGSVDELGDNLIDVFEAHK